MVTKMNFYVFSINCATRYVSAEEILNSSELTYGKCDKCGADKLVIWDDVIPVFECETVTKNRTLPDIMLYGGGLQSFTHWSVVSENVRKLFEDEKLTGAQFYPAELVYQIRGKYHKFNEQYYVMSVIGKAEIDFEAMGVNCSICETCEHYIFEGKLCPARTRKGIYPTIMKKDTWDGSDVFMADYCTERFVEKVLEAKLTGFEFYCFEQEYDAFENKKYFRTLSGLKKIRSQN